MPLGQVWKRERVPAPPPRLAGSVSVKLMPDCAGLPDPLVIVEGERGSGRMGDRGRAKALVSAGGGGAETVKAAFDARGRDDGGTLMLPVVLVERADRAEGR
jgi:hypothetical protein